MKGSHRLMCGGRVFAAIFASRAAAELVKVAAIANRAST
jgi:hypothetical protein